MYHYVFYNLSPSFLTDEQIADTEMYKALLSERMKVEKRLGEILKKRSWHKLKKGFCYYVIKLFRKADMYKLGVSTDINETLQAYQRMDVTFQVLFLMYFNTEKDMNDFDVCQDRALESSKILLSKEQVINLTSEEVLAEVDKIIDFGNFSDKVTIESPENLNKYNEMVPSAELI